MSVQKVETAAVLGSGVMGSGIAALLAGAGVRTYLLDIVPEKLAPGGDRNAVANGNLKAALKARPAPFYSADDAKLIRTGNLEDDLDKLAECDWVIEVIVENLKVKQGLMAEVSRRVNDTAIVSTNTSGIDVDAIVEGLPDGFRSRWLGTHFFNPARYMKLLEIIPGKDTDPAVTQRVAELGRNVLGKGIVFAKNTPNFIGNRIGAYGMMYSVNCMLEDGLTIAPGGRHSGQADGPPEDRGIQDRRSRGHRHACPRGQEHSPRDSRRPPARCLSGARVHREDDRSRPTRKQDPGRLLYQEERRPIRSQPHHRRVRAPGSTELRFGRGCQEHRGYRAAHQEDSGRG